MINTYIDDARNDITNLINDYLGKNVPVCSLKMIIELCFKELAELGTKVKEKEMQAFMQQEVEHAEDQLEAAASE